MHQENSDDVAHSDDVALMRAVDMLAAPVQEFDPTVRPDAFMRALQEANQQDGHAPEPDQSARSSKREHHMANANDPKFDPILNAIALAPTEKQAEALRKQLAEMRKADAAAEQAERAAESDGQPK